MEPTPEVLRAYAANLEARCDRPHEEHGCVFRTSAKVLLAEATRREAEAGEASKRKWRREDIALDEVWIETYMPDPPRDQDDDQPMEIIVASYGDGIPQEKRGTHYILASRHEVEIERLKERIARLEKLAEYARCKRTCAAVDPAFYVTPPCSCGFAAARSEGKEI